MRDNALPILLVGDVDRAEFRQAAPWLQETGVDTACDIAAALDKVRSGLAPALIVIAQTWPGEYSVRQIEQLRAAAPLARVIALCGSWLEGEPRSGRPWPASERVYWHQWRSRQPRRLQTIAAGTTAGWNLPDVARDDDRLLAELQPGMRRTLAGRVIAVSCRHRETADVLADVLRQHGAQTIWLRDAAQIQPAGVDLVLFDLAANSDQEIEAVARLKRALNNTPTIAIAGFPRFHDIERLQGAGATAVVSKPFLVEDLLGEIRRLCSIGCSRGL